MVLSRKRTGRKLQGLFVMAYRFWRSAFLIKDNRQIGLSVCILRLDRDSGPTMDHCTIDFPFLEKRMAETEVSNEIIGPKRQRLFVMANGVVQLSLFCKRIAEGNLWVWIIGLHCGGSCTVRDRLIHLAFSQKSVAEIVIRIPKIRLQIQSCPVLGNCLVYLILFKKYNAQIIVGHPAIWIFSQGCAPERFNIAIHRALSQTQRP